MKRKLVFSIFVLAGLGGLVAPLAAQHTMGPPKVLSILREEVKPARGGTHEKVETGYAQFFKKAKLPTGWLGMTAVWGNSSEAWFVTGYDSFAAFDKERTAVDKMIAGGVKAELDQLDKQDSELLSGARALVATYNKDLSYRAEVDIAHMRFMRIVTVRVRPGQGHTFEEARKIVNAAHEKANVDEHFSIFEVVAGAPAGTYFIITPLKSLAEQDDFSVLHGKAYEDALGEENRAKLRKMQSEAVIASETSVYAFNPSMSVLPKEWTDADPDFWTPKPKAAAKPAAMPAEKVKPKS
ncbi:MAG: hypothetical protein LAO31_19615 [Acidobacteriia bacterium]|nr:hypothetical protein [Terriglobia bacterium]